MRIARNLLLVMAVSLGVSTLTLLAQDGSDLNGKRVKVLMTASQKEVRGTLEILPDGRYRITTDKGIAMTLNKAQVYKILPLDDAPATPELRPGERRRLTEAEIEAVLGSENIDLGPSDIDEQVDLRAELPVNRSSVQEMLRIAGPKAKVMEFPHFVMAYSSTPEMARQLGARLESVYEWNVRYMEMLELPMVTQPDAKLEIFFFGTHAEYEAYQTLNGMNEMGAIGFYMRTNNRSAFFDMTTYPPYQPFYEQMNDPSVDPKRRTELKGKMARYVEHENLEVIQHEAAHHIHFNIGIFPKGGDMPRWQTEGLATMFEVPPSDVGASLGAINHYRLFHLRAQFGEKLEGLPPMRTFILNDGLFFQLGFHGYSIGWAMNHYFMQKKRDEYKQWMLLMATRDDDWTSVKIADKSQQFEEIFGEINDDWVADFTSFINDIPLRQSVLPPDFPP